MRASDEDADVTLSADVDTFEQILSEDLNPTAAFMSGKLSVDGDMGIAMKLASVFWPNEFSPAPYFEDVAGGPAGGKAHWVTLRMTSAFASGTGPEGKANGTVLMFPGRTEYIEKYGGNGCGFH